MKKIKKLSAALLVLLLFAAVNASAQVKVGGDLEVYGASAFDNGDMYRKFIKLDLDFKYALKDTSVVATLRTEKDTLRPNSDNYYATSENQVLAFYNVYKGNLTGIPPVAPDPANASLLLEKHKNDNQRVYLREGYINHTFFFDSGIDSVNLKLGKIIYTWGNSDELKPVDIINPQDYSMSLLKKIQERKYGVYSANVNVFFTETLVLEGIVLPFFEASETGSTAFTPQEVDSLGNKLMPPVEPEDKAKNFSYASRLGFSVMDVDMHANYFYGYDNVPSVGFKSILPPVPNPGIIAIPEYKKIQMFGFDFQKAVNWGIAVRGELAYFERGKYYTLNQAALTTDLMVKKGDGVEEKDIMEYTVGFDDQDLFGVEDLYFNFQYNQRIIFDYESELVEDQYFNVFMATVEYSFLRKKANLKAKGFIETNENSFGVNLEAKYRIADNYELILGTWIIAGDGDSKFGQYNDNDFLYVSAKATF